MDGMSIASMRQTSIDVVSSAKWRVRARFGYMGKWVELLDSGERIEVACLWPIPTAVVIAGGIRDSNHDPIDRSCESSEVRTPRVGAPPAHLTR